MALLLIEDCELVVSTCQNHIDIHFILADELRLNAGVVVEASQRIVDKLCRVCISVHPFEYRLELGRCRKVEAKRQVEEVGDRLFFGSSNLEILLEDLVELLR
jgi:methyl coenzyme M reductase subunit D